MQLSKQIKEDNTLPKYNINEKSNCILHFGIGNFHRAHQALYVHELIEQNYIDQKIYLLAPVIKARKGHYRELFQQILKKGFTEI